MQRRALFILCGVAAGAVSGLLGAGGGLILVPMLSLFSLCSDDTLFQTSLSVMIPICLVSFLVFVFSAKIPWAQAAPYLLGSIFGGMLARKWSHHISVFWLHRIFGILLLWGGVRYLL